jgi:acetyl esterase/lipase
MTTKPEAPPKGMWTVPVTITASDVSKELIQTTLRKTIANLGPGLDRVQVDISEITGEWQGVKHTPDWKSSNWSPQEKYAELEKDTKDAPVILYIHGGAYIVCSIDTHRPITLRMAECCGGRVFSTEYRLAPQYQFPAALIDVILAYKYLIDPPAGALHEAIDPANIVIAGDSAGVSWYLF